MLSLITGDIYSAPSYIPLLKILDEEVLPAEFAVVSKVVHPLPIQKVSRIKCVICNVAGKEIARIGMEGSIEVILKVEERRMLRFCSFVKLNQVLSIIPELLLGWRNMAKVIPFSRPLRSIDRFTPV